MRALLHQRGARNRSLTLTPVVPSLLPCPIRGSIAGLGGLINPKFFKDVFYLRRYAPLYDAKLSLLMTLIHVGIVSEQNIEQTNNVC